MTSRFPTAVVVPADASPWRPLHYDLLLHPNLENQTYEGYVHAVFRMQKNARKFSSKSNLIVHLRIQSGIHRYLSTNEYGVADDRTFWQTLHPSGVLSRNMDTWANYGGYPVLSALRVSDDRGPALVLKQASLHTCTID
ncbi:hypothetical protein V5799_017515 [Amblyomma americanum]|uniref:Uncharacterized protein n=1 Tax=Amblyomma americanum TaxID=6943 RepID=A0AAQ4F324_AMBAM